MNIEKKPRILQILFVAVALLAYASANHAAKNAGAYWSTFDSQDGANADINSGFVVVGAAAAQNVNTTSEGIGPFKSNGPSFEDPDVVMEEGSSAERKEKTPANVHWKEVSLSAGDTLSKIADQHGFTVKEIMQVNELKDEHKVREGQVLYIPDNREYILDTLAYVKELKKEAVEKRKQAAPVKITYYVVKNGDTLWSVANAFDLDINSLFGCNKISDTDILKVGTTLRVPNQDGIFVKIRPNQTVEKLAKEYGIYQEAIVSANEMGANVTLTQGKEIFLPGAKVMAFVETGKGKTAVASTAAKEKVSAKRGLGWPVVGKISSPFGWRKDPIRGGRDFHTGLDIRAPKGRPIVAASTGRVVYSGWMGGYGKTIVISHPGNMTTLYAHCSKLLVKTGTNISRGERIALVGSTGRSTGNHVHFEVRRSGTPVNPLKALR